MLTTFINALMNAEAEAVCSAEYGQISADRVSSPIWPVGAVLAEQHDEWIEGRRHLGLDVLSRSRLTLTQPKEKFATEFGVLSAEKSKNHAENSINHTF